MFIRVVSFAVVVTFSSTAFAADPAVRCESGKLKESAKYSSCRLKALAKGVQTATAPDYTKCEEKFTPKFNALETKAGPGICPTEGDEPSINARIVTDADDLATLLAAGPAPACGLFPATGQTTSFGVGDDGDLEPGATLQYGDNGDGTVTDVNTGLMWEKKILGTESSTPCSGEAGSCANPHHADNSYSWTVNVAPYTAYNGTAVTIFLNQLNNRCNNQTTLPCTVDADCVVPGGACGFAGYRDWRMPSKKELASLDDAGRLNPAIDPAFDGVSCGPACTDVTNPVCSCTASLQHTWSSTTFASSDFAWVSYFGEGFNNALHKANYYHVRAVRGGL